MLCRQIHGWGYIPHHVPSYASISLISLFVSASFSLSNSFFILQEACLLAPPTVLYPVIDRYCWLLLSGNVCSAVIAWRVMRMIRFQRRQLRVWWGSWRRNEMNWMGWLWPSRPTVNRRPSVSLFHAHLTADFRYDDFLIDCNNCK